MKDIYIKNNLNEKVGNWKTLQPQYKAGPPKSASECVPHRIPMASGSFYD